MQKKSWELVMTSFKDFVKEIGAQWEDATEFDWLKKYW